MTKMTLSFMISILFPLCANAAAKSTFERCSFVVTAPNNGGPSTSNSTKFKQLEQGPGTTIYQAVINNRTAFILHNSGKQIDISTSATVKELLNGSTNVFFATVLVEPNGGGSSEILDAEPLGPLFRNAHLSDDVGVFSYVVQNEMETLFSESIAPELVSVPDQNPNDVNATHVKVVCPR